MKKTEAAADVVASERGSVELVVAGYGGLAGAGFFGMLLLPVWGSSIALVVTALTSNETPTYAPPSAFQTAMWPLTHGQVGEILTMILSGVATFALLVLPALFPCLVLRARQKQGARIAWDEEGMTEHDGPWKRNVIPWSRMEAAFFKWEVEVGKYGHKADRHAIQIFDVASGDQVTTIWDEPPPAAPKVRRRVQAKAIAPLIEALRAHAVPMSRAVDWSRVEEHERRPLRDLQIWIARTGYFGAVLGPMIAYPAPIIGIVISVVAAALLAWRALPAWHELRVLRARLRKSAKNADEMPAVTDDGYRVAPTIARANREPADRIRLRAVWVEALTRGAFVALTLFAGVTNGIGPHN